MYINIYTVKGKIQIVFNDLIGVELSAVKSSSFPHSHTHTFKRTFQNDCEEDLS